MELKKILTFVFAVLFVLLLMPDAKAQERNLRVSLSGGGSFLKGKRAFIIDGEGFSSEFNFTFAQSLAGCPHFLTSSSSVVRYRALIPT